MTEMTEEGNKREGGKEEGRKTKVDRKTILVLKKLKQGDAIK